MALDPRALPGAALEFLTERHLATLTTISPDGRLHACAVGFTFDAGTATVRVITGRQSRKARNVVAGSRCVVAQVDGPRWLSLEGPARLAVDPAEIAEGEHRYTARYREPRPNPDRAVIVVMVEQVLGRA